PIPTTTVLKAYAKPRFILISRANVTCTASDVNAAPSWNRTPGRSVSVHWRTSGAAVQAVASLGTILGVLPSSATRVSYTPRVMRTVLSYTICGSKVWTLVSCATTSVSPAAMTCPARTSRSSSAPPMPNAAPARLTPRSSSRRDSLPSCARLGDVQHVDVNGEIARRAGGDAAGRRLRPVPAQRRGRHDARPVGPGRRQGLGILLQSLDPDLGDAGDKRQFGGAAHDVPVAQACPPPLVHEVLRR